MIWQSKWIKKSKSPLVLIKFRGISNEWAVHAFPTEIEMKNIQFFFSQRHWQHKIIRIEDNVQHVTMVTSDKAGSAIWFGRLLSDFRVKMFKVHWLDVKKPNTKVWNTFRWFMHVNWMVKTSYSAQS